MLLVSNYHYIRNSFNLKYPSIFGLKPSEFENQLIELSKHGEFISQNDLLDFKDKPFDKNYILITFDDGLAGQYEYAKPILDKLGIPFISFVNPENFFEKKVSLVHKVHLIRSSISTDEIIKLLNDKYIFSLTKEQKNKAKNNYPYDDIDNAYLKYFLNFMISIKEQDALMSSIFKEYFDEKSINESLYLSENQLKDLFESDSIGSHSYKHIPLGLYKKKHIYEDLKKSQDFFYHKFGKTCQSVSYPYGSIEACKDVDIEALKADFKLGFTMVRKINTNINSKNSLRLGRYDCNDLPQGKNNLFKSGIVFNN